MKKIFLVLILLCIAVIPAYAFDSSSPNNKFGIHLAVPHIEDIEKAAELVNSSGGKWGYVTLVIEESDRDQGKWQEIFNNLRRLHLIPIVRIATSPQQEGAFWRRSTKEDIDGWVNFLDSLNWVVKDRYVVLFNEPNHSAEWGGEVDAADYARVASSFADSLNSKNEDFFVMMAGLDASAPNSSSTQDEALFLSQVIQTVSDFFEKIEGWVSHSYPNPGFSGSPNSLGRGTIGTYEWELNYLRSLGVNRDLPVFITETGWSNEVVSPDKIAQNFVSAYILWLADNRVRAVTPFILNYQNQPFLNFSWRKPNSADYYPQFEAVMKLPKISGEPQQIQSGQVIVNLPKELLVDSSYHFYVPLKNEGQAVWSGEEGYYLRFITDAFESHFLSTINEIEPMQSGDVEIFLKTGSQVASNQARIDLFKDDEKILDGGVWSFEIKSLPALDLDVKTFPGGGAKGNHFELQIFDQGNQLVFKRRNVKVRDGRSTIDSVHNVFLGGNYRVVLLNPYYLPRQTFVTFYSQGNAAKFKVMLPLDFDLDGQFNLGDLWALIKDPKLFRFFLP